MVDAPARRIRRSGRDAGDLERRAVDQRGVPVAGVDDDRPSRLERIERGLRRVGAGRQHRLAVPVHDAQEVARPRVAVLVEALLDARLELAGRQRRVLEVARHELLATGQDVDVGVAEPGHHRAAAEVPDARAVPDEPPYAAGAAGIDDPPVPHRERANDGEPGVERPDRPATKDGVGRLRSRRRRGGHEDERADGGCADRSQSEAGAGTW